MFDLATGRACRRLEAVGGRHPLTPWPGRTVSPGAPTPIRTVQFQVGGSDLGPAVTLAGGSVTSVVIATIPAGDHTIGAVYSGDSAYAGETGTTPQTVTRALLTVTADAASKLYGAPVPRRNYTLTGFFNGENASVVSGAPGLATVATSASGVGSYPIQIIAGSLRAANYDFPNLVGGTLNVTPAPLTVTADDKVRSVGQPDPPLTASYSGFVNGDRPSSLTSPAMLATTANTSSPAGTYFITVGGAASPNYVITHLGGTLTVTPAPQPPLVTVVNVQVSFNKKHQVTQILVTFSGPLDAAEAQDPGLYRLDTAGKKGSFTARNAKVIKLESVSFNEANDTVTLTPKKPFKISKPVQLQISGQSPAGLRDGSGRFIDGDHNGTPGGIAVAILSRGGASIEAIASEARGGQNGGIIAIVDALFELDAFASHSPKRRVAHDRPTA